MTPAIPAELRERLDHRHGHFFDPALLADQLDVFEPPAAGEDIAVVDGRRAVDAIVAEIAAAA